MAAAKRSESAPTFGTVEPPKRHRKGGFEVSNETATALFTALSSAEGDGWVGDNQAYQTMGKAQAASQRYRKALIEGKHVDNPKRCASRVWEVDEHFYFALRLRTDDEVAKLGKEENAS